MKQSTQTAYIPGTCNLNSAESAYRRKAGYFGIGLFLVILAPLLVLDMGRPIRLILFIPAFIIFIGFLQAKHKFCVSYGASGLQNADEESDAAIKVIEAEAQALDRKRARQINVQAATYALVLTLVTLLIPSFS